MLLYFILDSSAKWVLKALQQKLGARIRKSETKTTVGDAGRQRETDLL